MKEKVNLEEIEKQKERLLQMMEKSQKEFRFVRVIYVIMMSISISLLILLNTDNQSYFRKDIVKHELYQLIKNGGELELVKHLYDNRVCVSAFKTLFLNDEEKTKDYYKNDIGLNIILRDLLTDYYLKKDSICDSLLYDNLVAIIYQYEAKNPFDNLKDNQKYYFVNIQTKLNSNEYSNIQSDVMKIADELKYKNGLVDKYLNKSEISFYISIAAIIITIILSVFQIIQSNLSNKKVETYLNTMAKDKANT